MRVTLVPSSVSPEEPGQAQYLISYLINDVLAVDAGCIGLYRTPREQARVRHVLLSHTHMDHIASLPFFLENVHGAGPQCVTVHAGEEVLEALKRDLFNGRLWPDFTTLARHGVPFMKLATLQPGQQVVLEGMKVTPVPVNHVVPTMGFLIEDDQAAVLIVSDTGPTEEIWRHANRAANLRAVFLEASFPDTMADVADQAKHLTPATFALEAKKLTRPVALFAMHIKAQVREQIEKELQALNMPNLRLARFGVEYQF